MTTTSERSSSVRRLITGRAVPVRGNDIDTDRIIPARFLRTVTFDGLGEHAFEDDRASGDHPFDDPRFAGASILVAGANFGCGSSREHAPQALMRWGIEAFVAVSFAEIFFGNCAAMGLPCLRASEEEVARLMRSVEEDPGLVVEIDVQAQTARFGGQTVAAAIPAGPREQLVAGTWDALGQLLEGGEEIGRLERRLPYLSGFGRGRENRRQ